MTNSTVCQRFPTAFTATTADKMAVHLAALEYGGGKLPR